MDQQHRTCPANVGTADRGTMLPLQADPRHSAALRWLGKDVRASVVLDDMEGPGRWFHPLGPCPEQDLEGTKTGYGAMSFTTERCMTGTHSLRLTSPTTAPVANTRIPGRCFGRATARRIVDGEDWTEWNRLSFWIFPTAPGFHTISMMVELHNEGESRIPDKYEREGLHFFLLQPGEWNQVVWEIPHLPRDRVTALDFVYRLQGNEPGAVDLVCFDIDLIELQQVDADNCEGWGPCGIAFPHTGYQPGSRKTALAPDAGGAARFDLVDATTGRVVLSRDATPVATALGSFREMDFSEFDGCGEFFLRTGGLTSGIFRIDPSVWHRTVLKTVNFMFCERCGFPIPGGHDVCHGDWQCRHGDRRIVINGGWHDAGDLSQGMYCTADAVYYLFRCAEALRDDDPALSARMVDEALWGLAWIRKTRFGDGFRCGWAVMDFWTDGVIGTHDDVVAEAVNDPFVNYLAAAAEARAARHLRARDPSLAERCCADAREDWRCAREGAVGRESKMFAHPVVVDAAGVLASLELYRATGESAQAEAAFELARTVMDCQQATYMEWSTPLCGFFHTDRTRTKILADAHITRCDLLAVALAELCDTFPGHPDWIRWYTSVALYAEYLLAVAAVSEPYRMLPGGIYRTDASENPDYRAQLDGAIELDEKHRLRLFPAWFHLRGNNGLIITQAKVLAAAARLRRNGDCAALCQAQLEWVVGRNPFAQSMMYGEGYGWMPQYSAMCGDIVGAIAVGIQTRGNRQEPYWSTSNCYNYKEVWMYTSARWLACMEEMATRPWVQGRCAGDPGTRVTFVNERTGARRDVATGADGRFAATLDEGDYAVSCCGVTHRVTAVPGTRRDIEDGSPAIRILSVTDEKGRVIVRAGVQGRGTVRVALLSTNLAADTPAFDIALTPGKDETAVWTCTVRDPRAPWIAVLVPGGDLEGRVEVYGGKR